MTFDALKEFDYETEQAQERRQDRELALVNARLKGFQDGFLVMIAKVAENTGKDLEELAARIERLEAYLTRMSQIGEQLKKRLDQHEFQPDAGVDTYGHPDATH